jgi:hypothetical protein
MVLAKCLFYFMFLHDIVTIPQINLDLSEWAGSNENNLALQHDCLHVTVLLENEYDPYEIISYCMGEWPSKWNIEKSNLDPHFTFADLYKRNITSQQLYLWSAPMDTIENYQSYLNENTISSMSAQSFFNCTLPRFGSMCQYSFDDYASNYNSLSEFIRDFYRKNKYKPTNLTCYTHLQCNRGAISACLDWTEICDGKIDCLNDAIDEEQCWQLENHECENDEFRCDIGQCISETFFRDNHFSPDCLDGTDENFPNAMLDRPCDALEPSFRCEDVSCTNSHWRSAYLSLTSSCILQRTELLLKAMFSDKPISVSDDCWSAFKCILHMPDINDPVCRTLCENEECSRIIRSNCTDMLYVPAVPVYFGHVYFGYTKNDSRYSTRAPQCPQYMCYNDQLWQSFRFIFFRGGEEIQGESLLKPKRNGRVQFFKKSKYSSQFELS